MKRKKGGKRRKEEDERRRRGRKMIRKTVAKALHGQRFPMPPF